MSDVLVAVVAYNNLDLTRRAIDALRNQTVDARIVVWDNVSTDGTREWLIESCPRDVELVVSGTNVMWTPAVNKVFQEYGDNETFLCMMNNDAAPLPSTLERMMEVACKPEVGLVGPVMERIGGPQDAQWHRRTAKGREDDVADLPPLRVNFVMGAMSLLRREVYEEIGPLDESMPLGADDHDYALRLKHRGYQIMVATNAFCRHGGHASERSSPDARTRWKEWGDRSWASFNEKWAGYFASEVEATTTHWDGKYTPGWDRGTGWESQGTTSNTP